MPDVLDQVREYWSDATRDVAPPTVEGILDASRAAPDAEETSAFDHRRRRRALVLAAAAIALLIGLLAALRGTTDEGSVNVITEPGPTPSTLEDSQPSDAEPKLAYTGWQQPFTITTHGEWTRVPAFESDVSPFWAIPRTETGARASVSVKAGVADDWDPLTDRWPGGPSPAGSPPPPGGYVLVDSTASQLGGLPARSVLLDKATELDEPAYVWIVWTVRDSTAYIFTLSSGPARTSEQARAIVADARPAAQAMLDSLTFRTEPVGPVTVEVDRVGEALDPAQHREIEDAERQWSGPGGLVDLRVRVCWTDPPAVADEDFPVAARDFRGTLESGEPADIRWYGRQWDGSLSDPTDAEPDPCVEGPLTYWIPEGAQLDEVVYRGVDPEVRVQVRPT